MSEQKYSAKINDQIVIYKDTDYYSTFPWAIKLNNGEIILTFRQASNRSVQAAKSGQVTHHDDQSWVSIISSDDNGESWKGYHKLYDSKYGVNDPALTQLEDGSILMRVTEFDVQKSENRDLLKGRIIDHRVEHGLVSQVRTNIIGKYQYKDGKLVLGEIFDMDIGDLTQSCSREPVLELPDKSLLFSTYAGAPYKTDVAYLTRSFGDLSKWGDTVKMFYDPNALDSEYQGINFNEASILSLGGGELVAMSRADISFHTEDEYMPVGGVGRLFTARSYNWGLSWTRPVDTEIFGQPAHLLHLGGDRVLCTYGYRKKPYGVRAMISYDRGKTWDKDNEIVLREDGTNWDLGYPMTLKINDNELLTVYYFNDQDLNRFICGTKWQLD